MQYITLISGIICCLLTFSMGAEKNYLFYPLFKREIDLPKDLPKEILKIVDPTGWVEPAMRSVSMTCFLGETVDLEGDMSLNAVPLEKCCENRLSCKDRRMPM